MDIIKAIQQMIQNYGQKNPQVAQAITGSPIAQGINTVAQKAASIPVTGFHNASLSDLVKGQADVANQAGNVAKDIGTTMAQQANAPMLQSIAQQSSNTAQQLVDRASKTSDPAEKTRLLSLAKSSTAAGQNAAQVGTQGYSPDVNVNPLLRAGQTALTMGTTADILGGIAGKLLPAGPLTATRSVADFLRPPTPAVAPTAPATALPAELPKTPVAPSAVAPEEGQLVDQAQKSFTSPAGVKYPFKTEEELNQPPIVNTIQKIFGKTPGTIIPRLLLAGLTIKEIANVLPKITGESGMLNTASTLAEAGGGIKSLTTPPKEAMAPLSQTDIQAKVDQRIKNPITEKIIKEPQELNVDISKLQALQGTPEYQMSAQHAGGDVWGTYAQGIDKELEKAQTQKTNQQALLDSYNTNAALAGMYENVKNALKDNTGFLNATNSYQYLQSSKDPSFANFNALINGLPGIDKEKVMNATGKAALAALDGALTNQIQLYQTTANNYGKQPQEPITIPTPFQYQPPAHTVPSIYGGGAGAGLPKAGPKGLPPLQPNGLPMKHKVQIPPKYLYR